MRLTVYDAEKTVFKILFKEKIMAGLAGYVENGMLSHEGIECACQGLIEFKERLRLLNIQNVSVFALLRYGISAIRKKHSCRFTPLPGFP